MADAKMVVQVDMTQFNAALKAWRTQPIWICGQLIGEWSPDGSAWDFQGVFWTEADAAAACRDENYFIFPATMGKKLGHDPQWTPECRWPWREGAGWEG